MDDFLVRRIKFLIDEAKNSDKRDQATTFVMRVVSNYASVNRDGGSYVVKQHSKWVSHCALDLMKRCETFSQWHLETKNDHQRPLQELWMWMRENAAYLTVDSVWKEFQISPTVAITNVEDQKLAKMGLRACGSPHRYSKCGISVVSLDLTAFEIFRCG